MTMKHARKRLGLRGRALAASLLLPLRALGDPPATEET